MQLTQFYVFGESCKCWNRTDQKAFVAIKKTQTQKITIHKFPYRIDKNFLERGFFTFLEGFFRPDFGEFIELGNVLMYGIIAVMQ